MSEGSWPGERRRVSGSEEARGRRRVSGLERRYRRLLVVYPREHRMRHGEEMVAVLMAGAEPGRGWPEVRDAYDVVRGGLAIRLHRAASGGAHWRDALDLAALIAPIALLVTALIRPATYAAQGMGEWVTSEEVGQLTTLLVHALPYGLAVLLACLGRPRAAAACLGLYALLSVGSAIRHQLALPEHTVIMEEPVGIMGRPVVVSTLAMGVMPLALCAVLLLVAPSPRPAALGAWRLLAWSAVVLGGSLVSLAISSRWGGVPVFAAMALGAGALALRTPVGRRTVLALAPMAAVYVGG